MTIIATGDQTPIPLARLVVVEVRKMFTTRSGSWLMMSIGITALIGTAATIAFAPEESLTYFMFATAIGYPMAFTLPIIAMLSVTSEWSQRSGLVTFVQVPRQGRVMASKALAAGVVGVAAMLVAFVIGAVGHLVGTAVAGVDAVWDVSVGHGALIVLGNLLSMATGYMLGVLLRSSAASVVAYFVYVLIVPGLLALLGELRPGVADIQGWMDFNVAQVPVFEGAMTGETWAQLAVSSIGWLLIPLAIGLTRVRRSEVT
ncbi:MAG: ABC transporter permease [Aeromicrobium sp.]